MATDGWRSSFREKNRLHGKRRKEGRSSLGPRALIVPRGDIAAIDVGGRQRLQKPGLASQKRRVFVWKDVATAFVQLDKFSNALQAYATLSCSCPVSSSVRRKKSENLRLKNALLHS